MGFNMSFGIACIVNKTTGRQFIFKSKNLVKKIENTRHQLNFGCHYNKDLQSDWDTFGPSNFNFNILNDNLESENDLNKEFIACLKNVNYVYNRSAKDLIQPLDCDIEMLINKLYDLTGNEINSSDFNQKLKENNLSSQDGSNFKIEMINQIKEGLINHGNFDLKYKSVFNEIVENNLIDSLNSSLEQLNFDEKIERCGLSEDIKLNILDELRNQFVNGEIENNENLNKRIDSLIQKEYSDKLRKDKAYERLYELTGENGLKRDFKYLLNEKSLSQDIGFKIRNDLKDLIEENEVTESNIDDIFRMMVDKEFENAKGKKHKEKQDLINFTNQFKVKNILTEHSLHSNYEFVIKNQVIYQIDQNSIKSTDDIEIKINMLIKDFEIRDVERRLNALDKSVVEKILVSNNLSSSLLSRKKSNINKIINNVPVNIIKEYLVKYTGNLEPIFVPNPNILYCPQCGTVNDNISEFCIKCGSELK